MALKKKSYEGLKRSVYGGRTNFFLKTVSFPFGAFMA